MNRLENKWQWSDEKFKRRIGTTKTVVQQMLEILDAAYNKLHEDKGIQDNVVSLSESAEQTLVTHQTHLCDTQCGKGVRRLQ